MIVRIGVSETPKEVEVDMPADTTTDEVKAAVADALGTDGGMLWLTDKDGRQIAIPSTRVAYVDIGVPNTAPKIGFGA